MTQDGPAEEKADTHDETPANEGEQAEADEASEQAPERIQLVQ